jgi:hypothetical protein
MVMTRRIFSAVTLAGLLLMPLVVGFEALAQESKTELAKKTQNPVADLISIPDQNNTNFSSGARWRQAEGGTFLNSRMRSTERTTKQFIKDAERR